MTANPASNMVISGPAIVRHPASSYPAWGPDVPCPTCGQKLAAHPDKKDGAKSAWKLPEQWNVPPGLCNELKRLQDLAYGGDAPAITLGACRSMMQMLFTQLPPEVRSPKEQALGFWDRLLGRKPADTGRKPVSVLRRAQKDGIITAPLVDAASRLPLEASDGDKANLTTAKQFVNFLIELADAIYAQPARLA